MALICAGCPGEFARRPESEKRSSVTADSVTADSEIAVADVPSPEAEDLVLELDRVLARSARSRTLSLPLHGAWQVLHGILAYGADFEVVVGGRSVSALQHLTSGGRIAGFDPRPGDPFGQPSRRGLVVDLQPDSKVGQGHRDQWLAVLAQAGLKTSDTVKSNAGTFEMGDWVRQVEYDIPLNFEGEFSWTLIALTSFRDTDHRWTARDGQTYNIESLLKHEMQQSIEDSACGGTHRLIGIASALQRRRAEGKPMTENWRDAQALLEVALELAEDNQNGDGSYSASYLHRVGRTADLAESLGTTGHVLEFVAIAADDETLRKPWVRRTTRYLIEVLDACEDVDLECGVLYHALHGLQELRKRLAS